MSDDREKSAAELAEKDKNAKPRRHVMDAYLASHDKYALLYKMLAE